MTHETWPEAWQKALVHARSRLCLDLKPVPRLALASALSLPELDFVLVAAENWLKSEAGLGFLKNNATLFALSYPSASNPFKALRQPKDETSPTKAGRTPLHQ